MTSDRTSKPGVTRNYASFSQASDENALSRIYIGYHFRKSTVDGKARRGYVTAAVLSPVATWLQAESGSNGVSGARCPSIDAPTPGERGRIRGLIETPQLAMEKSP